MSTPSSDRAGISRAELLGAAALFSTGGAAIKATALTGWQVASFRSGVAFLTVLAILPAARRRWTPKAIAIGAGYAATMILFVLANKLTTAANAIFLQSAAPIYLTILGPWLLGEPNRRRDLVFLGVVACGLACFFVGVEPPAVTAPHPLEGNLLGLLAGVCWALTVTGLRLLGKGEAADARSGATAVAAGNLFSFAFCLPWALPVGAAQASDWLTIAYLGVFQIGVAYALLTSALRHVQALEASLLLLVEPVLNPLWAWIVSGERPGGWSLVGGAIILTATAWKLRGDR